MQTISKEQLKFNVVANFRYVRGEYGITVREMAERLGLPEKTLGAIEQRAIVAPIHVYKLACLTNISMQTLYTTQLANQNQ